MIQNNFSNYSNDKVHISGYIALIFSLLFFSGIFKDIEGPLKAFDFTNVLGTFGKLGAKEPDSGILSNTFRGNGGSGIRDGWLFALTLAPAIIFAMGVIRIVEDFDGLKAAQKILSPTLRFTLGIPGYSGLSLIASLQSVDAGAAMTRLLYDNNHLNDKERLIYTGFQYSGGGLITNFLSSGAALFPFISIPILFPLLIVFVFKFISANIIRIYVNFINKDLVNG